MILNTILVLCLLFSRLCGKFSEVKPCLIWYDQVITHHHQSQPLPMILLNQHWTFLQISYSISIIHWNLILIKKRVIMKTFKIELTFYWSEWFFLCTIKIYQEFKWHITIKSILFLELPNSLLLQLNGWLTTRYSII